MGGKEAKERRRLKRQELQQTQIQNQTKQSSTPDKPVKSVPLAPPNAQSDPKIGAGGQDSALTARTQPKPTPTPTSGGRNNKYSRPNPIATKPKKPKHLKRKLQQLESSLASKSKLEVAVEAPTPSTTQKTDDSKSKEPKTEESNPKAITAPQMEAERAKLLKEMELFEKRKQKRVESFERKVRNAAGDEFDEETFKTLREKGASLHTILKASKNASLKHKKKSDAKAVPSVTVASAKTASEPKSAVPTPTPTPMEEDDTAATAPVEPTVPATEPPTPNNSSALPRNTKDNASPKQPSNTVSSKATAENAPETFNPHNSTTSTTNEDSIEPLEKSNVPNRNTQDADSSDDEDETETKTGKRVRGKKRKGRQKADLKRDQANTPAIPATTTPESINAHKKPRRCLGRKPLTDLIIGQRYPGTVVYLKPFGAFIDIHACHTEALCHISRIRDDYVSDINAVLTVGDEVNPRVVEINRRNKRVTVSLQSDDMWEHEQASAKLREGRKMDRKMEKKEKKAMAKGNDPSEVPAPKVPSVKEPTAEEVTKRALEVFMNKPESELTHAEQKRKRKLERRAQRRTTEPENEPTEPDKPILAPVPAPTQKENDEATKKALDDFLKKPESELTHAEQKRKRKLERRAQRRTEEPSKPLEQ